MNRVFAIGAAVACCGAAALPAAAGTTPKYLWATVNICDTAAHPDMMGVRASIPGDGDHTRMYMRFTSQYYSPAKQSWQQNGVSKWLYVGSGIYARRQAGYTFAFPPPASGQAFQLRGAVDFKWTKGRRIVRTAHQLTKGGHPNTLGADPKTYSADLCKIS